MFKFEKATYFQVDEPAVRQAPDVNFGEIAYRGDPQQAQLPPQQSAPPVQFDRPSDSLPNPQEYQQPPQQSSYQPPQQSGYAPTRNRAREIQGNKIPTSVSCSRGRECPRK